MTFDNMLVVFMHPVENMRRTAEKHLRLEGLWDRETGCLSVRVLQDFFVTVTRKVPRPLSILGPIVTANWKADTGEQPVVPLGGGVGRVFRVGRRQISASAQARFRHLAGCELTSSPINASRLLVSRVTNRRRRPGPSTP